MTSTMESLRRVVGRHVREGSSQTVVPRLTLHHSSVTTEPVQNIHRPALCIVLQGEKRAFLGPTIHSYDPDMYLITLVELPLSSAVIEASEASPYLGISLELDPDALSSLILQMPSDAPDPQPVSGIVQSPVDLDLIDALHRLTRLLDHPSEVPILAPLIEREILFRLLQGPQAGTLRQITNSTSRFARVERAAAWLREHYAEPARVEDLASIAGMSASTFHEHFKTVTAMSPLQYQKQVRLQEARRLLVGRPDNMAHVGFSVGYENPSQFSREYRRMFGSSPSADAARLASALHGSQPAGEADRQREDRAGQA